jgi:hypothetical protein
VSDPRPVRSIVTVDKVVLAQVSSDNYGIRSVSVHHLHSNDTDAIKSSNSRC